MNRSSAKMVLITGAGSGIGAATARRFPAEGANVVLCDILLDRFDTEELGDASGLASAADVAIGRDVQTVVAGAISRFGGMDILVANAGIDRRALPDIYVDITSCG